MKTLLMLLMCLLMSPVGALGAAEVIPPMKECMAAHGSQQEYLAALKKYSDPGIIRQAMGLLVIKNPTVVQTIDCRLFRLLHGGRRPGRNEQRNPFRYDPGLQGMLGKRPNIRWNSSAPNPGRRRRSSPKCGSVCSPTIHRKNTPGCWRNTPTRESSAGPWACW